MFTLLKKCTRFTNSSRTWVTGKYLQVNRNKFDKFKLLLFSSPKSDTIAKIIVVEPVKTIHKNQKSNKYL